MNITPSDATHVGPGGQAYKAQGTSTWIWQGNIWGLIRDLPAQAVEIKREWDGEGLPPVGTVCETRFPDLAGSSWRKVKILAHGSRRLFLLENCGDEFAQRIDECEFRPIHTAEEIAATEREAAIIQICKDAGSPECTAGQRRVAERLLDAGYVKRS